MVNGNPDERRGAVARALDLGINYFDTAAAYGQGRSERNLGRTLSELTAKPTIATKVTLEWSDLDDIPRAVEASVAGSLARLCVQQLDVVHLHNRVGSIRAPRSRYGSGALLTVDDVIGPGGVAETFRRLRDDGRVGVAGCCAFGGEPLAVAEIVDSGAFASVLVHYSMVNPTAWTPAIRVNGNDYASIGARAAARGMAVVALRILEGGVMSTGDRIAAAIKFAIGNSQLATALIGFSNQQQIDQACESAG
jgi:aryl-alcohol dehydrogenase-like predicted oxidoreductase